MSNVLMPYVESTFAAAIQRLDRAERRLERPGPMSAEEHGRLQADIAIARESIASGMRLLDLSAPERNHTPTLRLVK